MKRRKCFSLFGLMLAMFALAVPLTYADASPPNKAIPTEISTKLDLTTNPPASVPMVGSDLYAIDLPVTRRNLVAPLQGNGGNDTFSTQTLISFDGKVSQVLARRMGTLTNVLGKGISLDVNVFGGFSLTDKGIVGGGSLTKKFRAADQLDIVVGAFVQSGGKQNISGGLVFGASLHF